MCECEGRQIFILIRELRQFRDRIDQLSPDDAERFAHKDNVRIITDIAGCGTEMNNSLCFRALETVCIHVAHNIVTHLFLTGFRVLVIDIVRMRFEFFDLLICDIKSELLLCLCQRDPKFSPGPEFPVR